MANMYLKSTILEVVDNQLKANEPPVTKATYERLLALNYTGQQAKEKIAAVLLGEMYDILKNQELFDEDRYAKNLAELS